MRLWLSFRHQLADPTVSLPIRFTVLALGRRTIPRLA
jgi:hypothetical protein